MPKAAVIVFDPQPTLHHSTHPLFHLSGRSRLIRPLQRAFLYRRPPDVQRIGRIPGGGKTCWDRGRNDLGLA